MPFAAATSARHSPPSASTRSPRRIVGHARSWNRSRRMRRRPLEEQEGAIWACLVEGGVRDEGVAIDDDDDAVAGAASECDRVANRPVGPVAGDVVEVGAVGEEEPVAEARSGPGLTRC